MKDVEFTGPVANFGVRLAGGEIDDQRTYDKLEEEQRNILAELLGHMKRAESVRQKYDQWLSKNGVYEFLGNNSSLGNQINMICGDITGTV